MCCENPQCCQSHLLVQYSCCCGTLWKTSWTGHMLQSPPDFPWQVLLFLQARDGAPPRPAPQKWPEQTEGAHAAQPIPHKGASSQDQCWTKPLPFSAMPSFSDQAFQAHLALAQVIKGWGGNSLPNSTLASWIKTSLALVYMHQSLADEHGQMGLEEGEHGGPAPSWRHLFPSPPPTFPASIPPGSRAEAAASCSPPHPQQLLSPCHLDIPQAWSATSVGEQPGVTGVQQEAKMVNVPSKMVNVPSLQTGWSPTVQEAHRGEAPQGGGDYLPCTSALQRERQELCTL